MPPITGLGDTPKTIFLKGPESHKLHHEFQVATGQAVKVGQPVILNADGTVQAAAADAKANTVIGYSVHEGAADELITVAMKAFTIVWASPGAAVDAGPVKYAGLNGTDADYNNFAAAAVDGSDTIGWLLDQTAAADEVVRVALV